jgi:polysaccharide deacetylase 2 family uncharacterized protein YibQ
VEITLDRREFLVKGSSFILGALFASSGSSRVFASSLFNTFSHSQPRIALIIDDIGRATYQASQFLELGVPITFAILPRLQKTHKLAEEIHSQGHEIMLHQPMEPYESDIDPGPGALYVGDALNKIDRIMMENISGVPFAQGVNNHMGSRFTSCEKEMNEVLQVVKNKGFFFVDSLTTSHSAAYSTAKKLEVTAARRHIFMDNCLEEAAILSQLEKLKGIAMKNGYAIGIGHPFPETAKAVERFLGTLRNSPFNLVHISQVLS